MKRQHYLEPYRRAVDQYGNEFEVTLWASRETQVRRFDVFAQMCDLTDRCVLDAGCSRGDFAQFLSDQGVAYRQYVGIDGLPDVIEFAKQRGLSRAEFHCGDLLADSKLLGIGQPDVICISGTLNTMTDRQVYRLLAAALAATQQALLFNFLSDLCSSRAPAQTGPSRRLDTLRMIRWVTGQTTSVIYRQDYLRFGHDATVMMWKESPITGTNGNVR